MTKDHQLGDAPIQEEYRQEMVEMARILDLVLNGGAKGKDRTAGYVLMVYPFGEASNGRCNYISNGSDRKDVVILMKELIARFEGQPEITGRA